MKGKCEDCRYSIKQGNNFQCGLQGSSIWVTDRRGCKRWEEKKKEIKLGRCKIVAGKENVPSK